MRRHFNDSDEKVKLKLSTFKRILPFFKGHKLSICLAILGVISSTVFGGLLPLIFRKLVDDAIPSKNTEMIFKVASFYLVFLFLSVVVEFMQQLLVGFMGVDIVSKIKTKMLKHILNLSVSFFDNHNAGKLISRIESDCQQLFMLFSSVGMQLLWALINLVMAFIIMFTVNTKLAAIASIIIPVFSVGSYFIFKKMRPMFKKDREIYSKITAFLGEYIKGVPTLRSMGNLEWGIDKFHKINEERWKFATKIHALRSLVWFVLMLTPNLVIAFVLFQSVTWIKNEAITIGTVWLFIQYINRSIHPLIMVSEQIGEIQRSFGSADRIFEILDTDPQVKDAETPEVLETFQDKIEFRNVNFHYKEDEPVLHNISFEIEKGSTIALVGPTGCGKTTIISLLTRFYDPISGQILIDGKDISKISKDNLRSFMGLVLQNIYLFPGNVLDNIRVFRKDVPKEKVVEAARQVKAFDFITRMPDAFESDLAEDGGNLSFGERQLLSFARALSFSPEILILDEATSSIDPHTEMKIQKSLEKLKEGRTCIMVAHRLSTIISADKIIVLNKGNIEEVGTHDELLKRGGLYSTYYYKQLGTSDIVSSPEEGGETC